MVIDVGGISTTVSIVERTREANVINELKAKASFSSPHRSTSLKIVSSSSSSEFGGVSLDSELGTPPPPPPPHFD
jgi:hypothetical protein